MEDGAIDPLRVLAADAAQLAVGHAVGVRLTADPNDDDRGNGHEDDSCEHKQFRHARL